MKTLTSKEKSRMIYNELKGNWSKYRKLSLEEIRSEIKNKIRIETQNNNEQLSHEEFYKIIMSLIQENKNEKDRIKKKKNKKGWDDKYYEL